MYSPPPFRFLLAPDLAPPLAASFFLAAAFLAPLAFREVPPLDAPLLPVVAPTLLPDFLAAFTGDLKHYCPP